MWISFLKHSNPVVLYLKIAMRLSRCASLLVFGMKGHEIMHISLIEKVVVLSFTHVLSLESTYNDHPFFFHVSSCVMWHKLHASVLKASII